MLAPITRIDFTDYSESIPAFAVVSLMCFTYNIAVGITAGFLLYPFCKLVRGKAREVGTRLVGAGRIIAAVLYFLSVQVGIPESHDSQEHCRVTAKTRPSASELVARKVVTCAWIYSWYRF